jgi:hypothetical protein
MGDLPTAPPVRPPPRQEKQFPPLVKNQRKSDVPNGIIAHVAGACGGNAHDCKIVEVTSESFENRAMKLFIGS